MFGMIMLHGHVNVLLCGVVEGNVIFLFTNHATNCMFVVDFISLTTKQQGQRTKSNDM